MRVATIAVVFALVACGEWKDDGAAAGGQGQAPTASGANAGGGATAGGGGMATAAGGIATATGGTDGSACLGSYEDRDGDGWTGYYLPAGCPSLGVLAPNTADCDDSDPTRWSVVFRDRDGDGAGAGTETLCAAGGVAPDGYSTISTDCDDTDPGRSPLLLDTPGDGIDQDCDGTDGALCVPGAVDCPCNALQTALPPSDTSCGSFDLLLLDATYCSQACGGIGYVRLANLGTLDFTGEVTLTQVLPQSTLRAVFRGTIAAGTVTGPVHLGNQLDLAQAVSVSTSPGGDCNPSNDVYTAGVPAPLKPLVICR